ncbi:MAG: hypothetical protein Q7T01_02405 [bacterium]|nr:hypothetical protein [bacterium]
MASKVQQQAPEVRVAAFMSDVFITDSHGLLAECYRVALDTYGVRLPGGHLGGMTPHARIRECLRVAGVDPDPHDVQRVTAVFCRKMEQQIVAGAIVCDPMARSRIEELRVRGYRVALVHAGYGADAIAERLGIVDVLTAVVGAEHLDPDESEHRLVGRVTGSIRGARVDACCGIVASLAGARLFVDAGAAAIGIVGSMDAEPFGRAGAVPNFRTLSYLASGMVEDAINHRRGVNRKHADDK